MPWPAALGVCADLVYAQKDGRLYSNMAFGEYIAALGEHVERLVIFGRAAEGAAADECVHDLGDTAEFVALPYYASVADLPAVYRTLPEAANRFSEHLPRLDCVWIFGPHPVSLRFVKLAREAGVAVALGVRQDQPAYMRSRLTGAKRLLGVPYFDRLEKRWRALARELPTLTAGEQLAGVYGGAPLARATAFSLVRAASVSAEPVESARGAAIPDDRPLRMLSVGRIDPEKNPLLMPEIVATLRARHPERDWRLTVVGNGPLEGELRAASSGLGDAVELAGYVPFGPQLAKLYAESDLLLHVSHTEGLPQVLIESMAAGLPAMATDVGGVAAAVAGTGTPLVPPDDAAAAALALAALATDDSGRHEIAERGLARARELSVESQQRDALAHIAAATGHGEAP